MPHQDGPASFPVVAILSLGSLVVMNFTPHSKLRLCEGHEDNSYDGGTSDNEKDKWSPEYVVVPKAQSTSTDSSNTESSGEQPSFVQPQQFPIAGGPTNMSFPQFPHCVFVPFQAHGANMTNRERIGSDLNVPDSHLEAQKQFLRQQIEVLQNQLHLLQKPRVEENRDTLRPTPSDGKGKNVASASSSSSVSDCGRHGENDEADT